MCCFEIHLHYAGGFFVFIKIFLQILKIIETVSNICYSYITKGI